MPPTNRESSTYWHHLCWDCPVLTDHVPCLLNSTISHSHLKQTIHLSNCSIKWHVCKSRVMYGFGRLWEVVMAYIKVWSWHSTRGIEKIHKNLGKRIKNDSAMIKIWSLLTKNHQIWSVCWHQTKYRTENSHIKYVVECKYMSNYQGMGKEQNIFTLQQPATYKNMNFLQVPDQKLKSGKCAPLQLLTILICRKI